MKMPILPATLRQLREEKGWSQQTLADKAHDRTNSGSVATIKRIESCTKDVYLANEAPARALAKALGVTVEALAQTPSAVEDHEKLMRKVGVRPLRTVIDDETALAFNMVQHLYGISIKSQIEMAPLFMALLAEASLAWRRARVAEIEEAAAKVYALGGGHFSFTNAVYRVEDGARDERKSIEMKDLFGARIGDDAFELGFDPGANNPFADFLRHMVGDVRADTIAFDDDYFELRPDGFPRYRVGAAAIAELTAEDPDAEFALLRGYVRIKDIPAELLSTDRVTDRVAWMIDQIPAEVRAEQAAFLAELGIDVSAGLTEADGGDDA